MYKEEEEKEEEERTAGKRKYPCRKPCIANLNKRNERILLLIPNIILTYSTVVI